MVAKQAAPNWTRENPVVQLQVTLRLWRNVRESKKAQDDLEKGFVDAMLNVDKAAKPFDDNDPYQFPDPRTWKDSKGRRSRLAMERQRRRNEQEVEIEKKLKTPVSVAFNATPLSKVMEYLRGGRERAPGSVGPGGRRGSLRTRRSPSRSATK